MASPNPHYPAKECQQKGHTLGVKGESDVASNRAKVRYCKRETYAARFAPKWRSKCRIERPEEQRVFNVLAASLTPLERETMKNLLMKLWKEEEGQDLTEYALLLVLLSLAAVGALGTLANAINNAFSKAATNLSVTT